MKLDLLNKITRYIKKTIGGRSKKTYIIAGSSLVFLILQFAIPPNYVVPRTYIDSRSVSLQNRDELREQLATESEKIEINFDSQVEEFNASKVGIEVDVDATINLLPTVKLKDRFIPFKPLYLAVRKVTVQPLVKKDKTRLKAFAESTSAQHKKEPVSAVAVVKDKQLNITKDMPGTIYDAAKIEKILSSSSPVSGTEYKITPEKLPAKTQEKELLPLKDEFIKKTSRSLKVRYGDTNKVVEQEALKDWLAVMQDPATGKWSLGLNPEPFNAQLQLWAKEYNIAAGITQVSYYDDVETSRKTGAAGRALNAEAIKGQLAKWFESPVDEPVALVSGPVAPKIIATRTYSRSSAQLQAKLDAWIASHGGRYQVAIRELGGRGREASYNVAQQTIMASTYKTFLAFVAYKQAEAGALNLGTQLVNGKNIEQCIEVMIVVSDNTCAVKLGQHIGWAKVDQVIASAGFQGVVLNNYDSNGNLRGDKLVNAQEQAKFLAQLSGGSLVGQGNTNQLISYMKRQTYRNGIPAGSRGAAVADKVGFLDAYIHDVGIVYGSKSTYALVIMSEGSSWTNVRDLAQAVYDFMNE